MKLKTISYTRLLKLELPAFARSIIEIIERHNPERLKIKEIFDLLVAQKANINLLMETHGPHPVTQQLKPVRKNYYMHAQAIVYKMKLAVKLNAGDLTYPILEAEAIANDYLHGLVQSKSEAVMISRVRGFLEVIDSDDEVKATFASFGLMREIEELRHAHTTLQELLMKRTQSISERPRLNKRETAAPVIKTLKYMFIEIELAQLINKELDYEPLFNELNEIIGEYKNRVNRRLLHNKKKSEAVEKSVAVKEETVAPTVKPVSSKEKPATMTESQDDDSITIIEFEKDPKDQSETGGMFAKYFRLPNKRGGD